MQKVRGVFGAVEEMAEAHIHGRHHRFNIIMLSQIKTLPAYPCLGVMLSRELNFPPYVWRTDLSPPPAIPYLVVVSYEGSPSP